MPQDFVGHSHEIHILVADDSPFHTELLVSALSQENDFKVFSSNLDIASVEAASAAHNIDVFVLSAVGHGDAERGLRILSERRQSDCNTRAVILLDSSKPESVLDSFREGARGVFDHREAPDVLCRCIRQVHDGKVWINNKQMALVLESLSSAPKLKTVDARGTTLLSQREAEVVRYVAEGLTNREIADRLRLSQHTIKNHLLHIFDKLGVCNRTELLYISLSRAPQRTWRTPYQELFTQMPNEWDPASLAVCEEAAEKGILAAELILAHHYWASTSDYDPIRAYTWFSMALDRVASDKNRVKRVMSPEQLADAECQLRRRAGRSPKLHPPVGAVPSTRPLPRSAVA